MAHFYDTVPAELKALPHREAVEQKRTVLGVA